MDRLSDIAGCQRISVTGVGIGFAAALALGAVFSLWISEGDAIFRQYVLTGLAGCL